MFGLFRTLEENDNLNLHIKKIDISKIQGSPHFTFHVDLSTFTYNLPYMMVQNYHYKESILKYYKHKNYKLYYTVFPLTYIYRCQQFLLYCKVIVYKDHQKLGYKCYVQILQPFLQLFSIQPV